MRLCVDDAPYEFHAHEIFENSTIRARFSSQRKILVAAMRAIRTFNLRSNSVKSVVNRGESVQYKVSGVAGTADKCKQYFR